MSKTNDTINEVRELGIDAYLARQQDKSLLQIGRASCRERV